MLTPPHTLSAAVSIILFVLLYTCSSTYASVLEIRSLLEFKKGIKTDPLGNIFSTWKNSNTTSSQSQLSKCPSTFYGVICDQTSTSVVAVHLDGLGLTGKPKLKTLLPLKSLQNITISTNFFTGRLLGTTFGRFNSLKYLDISNNQLYGHISSDILQGGVVLEWLDLSGNQFSGSFPTVNSSPLVFLDLSNNNLSGQLPFELDKLHGLEYLDLSENNFTGVIPEKLSSKLLVFNVSYNNLEGNIPENLRTFSVTSFYPGNTLLVLRDHGPPSNHDLPGKHRSSKSWVKIGIIVACIGVVFIIVVLVFVACDLAHHRYFRLQKGSTRHIAGMQGWRLGCFRKQTAVESCLRMD